MDEFRRVGGAWVPWQIQNFTGALEYVKVTCYYTKYILFKPRNDTQPLLGKLFKQKGLNSLLTTI